MLYDHTAKRYVREGDYIHLITESDGYKGSEPLLGHYAGHTLSGHYIIDRESKRSIIDWHVVRGMRILELGE